ncbi:spore germination protein [Clostridium sp. 'deep sea']|uniref:spore germination protein n=1 Tax=Clostridium sp. 'deep sea' TaxID=2779445 RepID=UPI0018966492|nr:spore germination protein [Clostridium sp. 'deep sea']QOR36260.1 spore germination protein [Clostridium sp. 'deep sea']
MLKWIKNKYKQQIESMPSHDKSKTDPRLERQIAKSLFVNQKRLEHILGDSDDIIYRNLTINIDQPIAAMLIYIRGLIKKDTINENILKPLMYEYTQSTDDKLSNSNEESIFEFLQNNMLTVGCLTPVTTYQDILSSIFSGNTVLIINGEHEAISMYSKGWDKRGVTEPQNDISIRGSHEGFTESIRTNTAMIRRRIKNHNLRFESFTLGRYSKTKVCLAYIKGIANEEIINEARKRINKIDIDGILESGYIEQYINDSSFSIFPTLGHTEKPDIVSSKLLEGRIAIVTDSTPTVLTAPFLFAEVFQSPGDYYSNFIVSSVFRIIRWITYFLAVALPGFYVAAQAFHYEMIPTKLMFTIAAAQEGVPFSGVIEILLMSTFFVILREAGIRMPRSIGTATSIVGALVLGDAAITAGLVGAPAVMVTAVSGLSTFVVPILAGPITILRVFFILLGGCAGIYGISLGLIFLLAHMSALTSFGIPYMAPIAPFNLKDQRDELLKAPIWADLERPNEFAENNIVKQNPKSALKPLSDGEFIIENEDDKS